MSITKVTLTIEEADGGLGVREMTISRTVEELEVQELLYFLSEAVRAAGFSYVESIGCKTINGDERWSEF